MKKCALILGLILLSSGIVFAHLHESYDIYRSQTCYIRGHYKYCMPSRIMGRPHERIYYPAGPIGVGIYGGGIHSSMSPVMRSMYYPPRPMRHRGGISVRVSI